MLFFSHIAMHVDMFSLIGAKRELLVLVWYWNLAWLTLTLLIKRPPSSRFPIDKYIINEVSKKIQDLLLTNHAPQFQADDFADKELNNLICPSDQSTAHLAFSFCIKKIADD